MTEHTTSDRAWIDELLYKDNGATDRHAFDEGIKAARDAADALDRLERTENRSDEAIGDFVNSAAQYASQVTHVALNYEIRISLLRSRGGPDNESIAQRLESHRDKKLDELFNEMASHGKVDRARLLALGLIKTLSTLYKVKRLTGC